MIGISLQVEGEEFEVQFQMPDHVSDDDKIENAQKMGSFLTILQQGKLASLVTFSAAKWGILNNREEESQIMIKAIHVGMGLRMVDGEILEPPVVSPMEAFVMRKDT